MKIAKKVLVEKEIVQAVACNMCGHDCYGEGLVGMEVSGGFGSVALGDMCRYQFSLCELCLWDIFQRFKIPPTFGDGFNCQEDYDKWKEEQEVFYKKITADPNWRQHLAEYAYRDALEHGLDIGEKALKGNNET